MTAKPRVLLTRAMPSGAERQSELAAQVDLVDLAGRDPDPGELAVAEGIVVVLPSRLTAEQIAQAPLLRVVASYSAGTDHIDVASATDQGIAVASGQGTNAAAVAEYTIANAIIAHRRLPPMGKALAEGGLEWGPHIGRFWPMDEFAGSTLGIVGYGHIGRGLEERAAALGAAVVVFDPFVAPGPTSVGSLDELMRRSDTVSVNVPLTDQTRSLIGRAELMALGPNGVLIQASHGGVVDHGDLVSVLAEGGIRWAVLDVFDVEPPTTEMVQALVATGRVTLTPHVAGVTAQALDAMAATAVDAVLGVLLRGEQPPTTVNARVFAMSEGDPR